MEDEAPRQILPFGLWEMDAAGTVLHYEPPGGERAPFHPPEVVGKNFFVGVMPAARGEELRERFASFLSGHAPAYSLDLTLPGEEGDVRARILLGRLHDRFAADAAGSILVHVRRA